MQNIQQYSAVFTAINQPVILAIPRNTTEVALRVHREVPGVSVLVLQDEPLSAPTFYQRTFMLVPANPGTVPANFLKYIGAFPFGTPEVETYVVEITNSQTVDSFEIEQVS
jgi:hypothetical protein